MRFSVSILVALLVSTLLPGSAHADLISLDRVDCAALGVNTSLKREALENSLNQWVFNPLGIEFEAGAPTGGTLAVDDMVFEGPGLTVITGWGFILRFTDRDARSVRAHWGDYKNDGDRTLYAFDPQIDYTRSTTLFSQSNDGNPTGWTEAIGSNLGSATGTVPISLTVTDNQGRISSVWGDTNLFLTTLEEIEIEWATPIPEPSTCLLVGLGLLGAALYRRRRSR